MTIYTDQVTGKKYDRVRGGVAVMDGPAEGYKPCSECAFYGAVKQGEECGRGVEHCVSNTPSKTVFFVFKERKA